MSLERRAREFATFAHYDVRQVRKYTGEPYITHPAAVVEIVRSVPHTEEMLAATWLHDTVEDTQTSHEQILEHFGETVAKYVWFLTDISKPADGNRKIRKMLDRQHISQAPPEVKTIKLADLIHNTESIVAHDPEFAATYLGEKALLLTVLEEGDPTLFRRAYKLLMEGERLVARHFMGGSK